VPIVTIQLRPVESGRVRLGVKTAGAARAIDRLRFTSPDRGLIERIAAVYGGQVRAWDNDSRPEWEVITEAREMRVTLVEAGWFDQWLEEWTRAGCVKRCDGAREQLAGTACVCAASGLEQEAWPCKPRTRLRFHLADVAGSGLWRLDAGGWHAAASLAGSEAEVRRLGGVPVGATLRVRKQRGKAAGQATSFVTAQLVIDGQAVVESPEEAFEDGPLLSAAPAPAVGLAPAVPMALPGQVSAPVAPAAADVEPELLAVEVCNAVTMACLDARLDVGAVVAAATDGRTRAITEVWASETDALRAAWRAVKAAQAPAPVAAEPEVV
jgi:hypothetical protein